MIKKPFNVWLVAAVIIGGLLSYVSAQHTGHTVELKNAQGESIGTATLVGIRQRRENQAQSEELAAGAACNSFSSDGKMRRSGV